MRTLTSLFITPFIFLALNSFGQTAASEIEHNVEKIHHKILTIDSHNDTPMHLMDTGFDISKRHDPVKDHSRVDFPRMKEGGMDASFFAVFVSQGKRTPEGNFRAKERADAIIDSIYATLARFPGEAGMAISPSDAYKLKRQGKRAIFIGMENGYPIGNDLSLIKAYYNKGVRYITLCHTRNNDICDSSTDSTEYNGLSEFGRNVVKFMNMTGMMVDVSHISDKAVKDVLAFTRVPVIASHSCAKALCNNPRNLSDELLRAIARNGGVIQMCILSEYVKTPPPNPARDSARAAVLKKYHDFDGLSDDEMKIARKEWNATNEKFPQKPATVSDVVDHIDHMVKVAGINHVGIGTDFDGGGGVDGCFDVSEMGNITLELVKRGYTEHEIRKIWGGNIMRVMDKTAQAALQYKLRCECH